MILYVVPQVCLELTFESVPVGEFFEYTITGDYHRALKISVTQWLSCCVQTIVRGCATLGIVPLDGLPESSNRWNCHEGT